MRILKILPVCILLSNICFSTIIVEGQSPSYTIEAFSDAYVELEEFESVAILTKGDPLWYYQFDLEFLFPFYEANYSSIIYDHSGWGSMTDEDDEALFLMQFLPAYTYDNVIDTLNIESDVRFSHLMQNGLQSLVMQFTNVRFFADPFADSLDTRLNFQLHFFQNGVIEVRFGEMYLDNSPIYRPGRGFFCYTSSGGVDTNEVCGPHMGISNPVDNTDAIGLQGAYDDYEVVGDIYSILTVLPPEGWVIRFKPMSVSTTDSHHDYNLVVISPNPATSQIRIPQTDGRVMISDATGRAVWRGMVHDDGAIDISSFPPGIYFLQQISPDGISTGKFVKE